MMKVQQDIPVAHATVVAPNAPSERNDERPLHNTPEPRGNKDVVLPQQASKAMDKTQIRALLEQGFTRGLAEAMTQNNATFPLRIWIVDNSGSMRERDGNRIVQGRSKGDLKMVQCTRWTEIQGCVDYHAKLAGFLQVPTVFRLLNDPGSAEGRQQFSVAERGQEYIDEDIELAIRCMRSQPTGLTPLTSHVRDIRKNIRELEPTLKANGARAVLVIATDGLPSGTYSMSKQQAENEFVEALRSLEGLPVWLVIRLCTDDLEVVEFYNQIDSQLELNVDVLDDFVAEAKEVYDAGNKFLNYALPLHRCREMGFHHRLFDIIDERQLGIDELPEFFALLFGEKDGKFDGVADPQVNWSSFMKGMARIVEAEPPQWNPITKKVEPWINLKKLDMTYRRQANGGGLGCACNIM
jgi:Mg-chelatase subunit ChlD